MFKTSPWDDEDDTVNITGECAAYDPSSRDNILLLQVLLSTYNMFLILTMYFPSSDLPALWMVSLVPSLLLYTLMSEEQFTGTGLPSLYHWRDWMLGAG